MITLAYDVLGLLLALLPFVALAVVIAVIVCAGRKVWPRLPRWMRIRRVPSRNPDGRPLSQAMTERLAEIERGYAKTAREPGRRR
jgi:hypothetical protein